MASMINEWGKETFLYIYIYLDGKHMQLIWNQIY